MLLIDNDKQGDASKLLNRHSYKRPGTGEILTDRNVDMTAVIQSTDYEGLDIVMANMNLLTATLEVMLDQKRPQHNRFRRVLEQVEGKYNFCIIDNAPDLNISTINALAVSDDVLVPVTIDDFAIDGLKELVEQIDNTRQDLNPGLRFCGCFITQYDRTNKADTQGEAYLKGLEGRSRDVLAQIMGMSQAQIGRYQAIYNHLVQGLMETFREGSLSFSVASELCGLPVEW